MEKEYIFLKEIINTQILHEGTNDTLIPCVKIFKSSKATSGLKTLYDPALLVIIQGSKIVTINKKSLEYNVGKYLISSTYLPVSGKITNANENEPFLSVKIEFSNQDIFDAIKEFNVTIEKDTNSTFALSSHKMSESILDIVKRLVALIKTPKDIEVLSKVYLKELLYRLIVSENSIELKQFSFIESNGYKISKAVNYINTNYGESLNIEELANYVNMSQSSFFKHFKNITSLTPLQYIKIHRLQVAKRMIVFDDIDVTGAAFSVGYQSLSQFSRDYLSYFGVSPKHDKKSIS